MEGLRLLEEGDWKSIKEGWLKSEKGVGWEKTEGGLKGHVSRREAFFEAIEASRRKWKLFEIKDPSRLLIGPFPKWHAFFNEPQVEAGDIFRNLRPSSRTFARVVHVRPLTTKVEAIMQNYPQFVQLVGGYVPDFTEGWEVPFVLDASHRSEGWARMTQEEREGRLEAGQRFTLALTEFTETERQKLYKRINPPAMS